MKKTTKKAGIPDLTEYTDADGKKWVQTSTEDLFSIKELNEILESIDKSSESDEIILARIDFQKVNKEYYEMAMQLQKKLHQQGELLKKVITDARAKIDRKNRKLKELIDYIKQLHLLLAHLSADEEELKKLKVSPEVLMQTLSAAMTDKAERELEFEEVEETEFPLDADTKKRK
ncbi:MAG TPA: hypothetical protein PKN50_13310 [Spirochaetota bacterium]|jgi:hypothetical protein|nr:hypothetical protein [Spirochaetota bacterium]HPV42544.1 hypothetical protein [Spirochaetota bacterium]